MTLTTTEIVKGRTALAVTTISTRADRLADRILLGAAKLASFALSLTAEEWEMPVSANDKRTIGVIVHHVGNMYPAEVSVAQAIGKGTTVTDITGRSSQASTRHTLRKTPWGRKKKRSNFFD